MDACVTVKDRLLAILNDAESSGQLDDYMRASERVLTSLEDCAELFQDAGYSYKSREIAERIQGRLHAFMDGAHHNTIKMIQPLIDRAYKAECMHHRLQQEWYRMI